MYAAPCVENSMDGSGAASGTLVNFMLMSHPSHTFYRAAALALAACLALVPAGCNRPAVIEPVLDAPSSEVQQAQPVRLAIAASPAGFNPYLAANTLVEQTGGLLFEKLLEIAPDMALDYRLAQSVACEGLTVTIRLRSGLCFADGSPITAGDVAESLRAAQASALYGARLANLADVEISDSSVVLTLSQPDSLFAYLLDLPVLKAGETGLARPTASGRYTYGPEENTLTPNPHAPFPEDGPDVIELTAISNYDEMVSGLAMGTVNFYLADDSASSTIASSENYFRTNRLVFLGVNAHSSNPLCSTSNGRRLLSALISRRELAGKYPSAVPATGTLNSYYECVNGKQVIQTEADPSLLEDTMAALGYTYKEASGFYEDARGQRASVDVLVHSGNANRRYTATLLQQQWAGYGIEVTLTEADDFNTWLQLVQSTQFELYIGEMKLYNNMDLTPFWSGSARYGLAASPDLVAVYDAFRADAGYAGEFEDAFAAEMPYIPLLWHGGVTVSSRRVSGIRTSVSNLYYSLAGLTISR